MTVRGRNRRNESPRACADGKGGNRRGLEVRRIQERVRRIDGEGNRLVARTARRERRSGDRGQLPRRVIDGERRHRAVAVVRHVEIVAGRIDLHVDGIDSHDVVGAADRRCHAVAQGVSRERVVGRIGHVRELVVGMDGDGRRRVAGDDGEGGFRQRSGRGVDGEHGNFVGAIFDGVEVGPVRVDGDRYRRGAARRERRARDQAQRAGGGIDHESRDGGRGLVGHVGELARLYAGHDDIAHIHVRDGAGAVVNVAGLNGIGGLGRHRDRVRVALRDGRTESEAALGDDAEVVAGIDLQHQAGSHHARDGPADRIFGRQKIERARVQGGGRGQNDQVFQNLHLPLRAMRDRCWEPAGHR